MSRQQVVGRLSQIKLQNTQLYEQCPVKRNRFEKEGCPTITRYYRTADGYCNNLSQPEWGGSMRPLFRFLPPVYNDGLESPRRSVRGSILPSARRVSAGIHRDLDNDLTPITHMIMQWGQFLDHDLTSSAQTRGFNGSVPKCCSDDGREALSLNITHPDCFPIQVPPDDPFYRRYGIRCLEFVRSSPTPRPDCSLGPREQVNQVTSYIDASTVYGSTEREIQSLRLFRHGMMQYTRVQFRKALLPPSLDEKTDLCRPLSKNLRCFRAGDKRVNEQPGLIASHIIWLREHNRLASRLQKLNPHWSDERLFQEARRIVAAMIQHISFREFLPLVLGKQVMEIFELTLKDKGYYYGYDERVNPSAANAFGTAAFRFGHSLVQRSFLRCDKKHNPLPFNVSLREEMTDPGNLYNFGSVDRLMLGLCVQRCQKRDEFITQELTNHLFQTPTHPFGMDLASLNIQRGRDHGLPSYNQWRETCGLKKFTSWAQLLRVMDIATKSRLREIYNDIDDIDLFPGAMAEKPVPGGLVGATFACILAQQFLNLRKGDRFWYENGGTESAFTLPQLKQLRRVTFARVLCDNLDDVESMQPFIFLVVNDEYNKLVSCNSPKIPWIDLTPWKEHSDIPPIHSSVHVESRNPLDKVYANFLNNPNLIHHHELPAHIFDDEPLLEMPMPIGDPDAVAELPRPLMNSESQLKQRWLHHRRG